MSARDTLDRLTRPQPQHTVEVAATPAASAYEGMTQRDTPSLMLTLVKQTGDRLALNYAYLTSVSFSLSGELVLEFADQRVTIKGTSLEPVFNAVVSHTATRIVQSPSAMVEGNGPVIRSIHVEELSK